MSHKSGVERRSKTRLRLPRMARVRPSNPSDPQFRDWDEILPTQNAAVDNMYFITKNKDYKENMRVFVTFPYSEEPGSINREFLGRVVRVQELDHDRRGIAIHLLMPVYLGGKETIRR